MDKELIEAILDYANEELLKRFYETMLNEINSDDESYYMKARQLLLASLKQQKRRRLLYSHLWLEFGVVDRTITR